MRNVMTNKLVVIILLIGLSGLLVISACESQEQKTTTKVIILFDSPLTENTFSLACLRGAEKAKIQYGIELTFSEAGSDAEAEVLLARLAESKRYDIIISVGTSQTFALRKIAVKYSKQKFASVDGDIADIANVSSLLIRDNESSFLAGALAAWVTKTGRIGFIGGRDEPSIQRFLAGYKAGAKSVKPDCQIAVSYAGSWLNDGTTKRLAWQQISEGADILYGPAGAGSLGVIEAARQKGLWAIGVDADQSPLAPLNVLFSAIKNVDVSVFETIRSVVEINFKGGVQSVGLKEGAVAIKINSALSVITPAMQANIGELEKKIISGEIRVPEQ
jgi:basic membrane protein A